MAGQRPWLVLVVILSLLLISSIIVIGVLASRLTGRNVRIPDLKMHPNPEGDSFIGFSQGQQSTYRKYMDDLEQYLQDYADDKQQKEAVIDCSASPNTRPEGNQVCRVPLDDLGPDCTSRMHFGYDEGRPCVLLNMEKVFNFSTTGLCDETQPDELRELQPELSPSSIVVSCDGANAPSKDNIGRVTYYPRTGFATKYLPYLNQPDYLSPLVMVQFQNPQPGVVISVVCKIWADKIRHEDPMDDKGTVRFSLLVD